MDQDCLQALYDQAPLCIHAIGADGRLVAMNPAGLVQVGADSEDAVRGRPYLDFVSLQDRDSIRRLMAEAFAGQPAELEFDAAGPPPARRLASCFIPVTGSEGRVMRLVGITRDRSQRQQAEEDLRRLSRAHAVLSRCNRSLARAVDEHALLDAFCTNFRHPDPVTNNQQDTSATRRLS